jgi:hypothetical protein
VRTRYLEWCGGGGRLTVGACIGRIVPCMGGRRGAASRDTSPLFLGRVHVTWSGVVAAGA